MMEEIISEKKIIIEKLRSSFRSYFGDTSAASFYTVPASLILLGDHTHYNEGILLATSINRYCGIAIHATSSDKISAVIDGEKFVFPLNEPLSAKGNSNWILNCLQQSVITLIKYDLLKSGFNIIISMNIPQSLGIGSSAALFIGIINAVTDIFKLKTSRDLLIEISCESELSIYGKISNRALHYSSFTSSGKTIKFVDLRNLRIRNYKIKTEKFDLLIADTGIPLQKPSALCNERIEECSIGVKGLRLYIWGIKSLRDVQIKFLQKHINMLPRRIFNRCLYNVNERIRVEKALKELRKSEFKKFAGYLFNSHQSLSEEYEVSSEELDYLVDRAKEIKGVAGAKMISCSPMRSIILLTERSATAHVSQKLSEKFLKKYNRKLEISHLEIENGLEKH